MEMLTRRGLRSLRKALVYLFATGVAAALFAEALLQVAAWLQPVRMGIGSSWRTGSFRILCLGDSNTFGMYLDDRAKAWPGRLEEIWNASGRSPRIETMNLGYPGTSTSLLLQHLPKMLEVFRPDLVLVMVGVNDFWTIPIPIDLNDDRPFSVWRFVEQHSRLHRLVYLAVQSASTVELVVDTSRAFPKAGKGKIAYGKHEFVMDYRLGDQPRSEEWRGLFAGLESIASLATESGVRLVLLTYPSRQHDYALANQAIRNVAKRQRVTLIDLADAFAHVCSNEICEELFVPDQHPNADGYRVAAEILAEQLDVLPADLLPSERARHAPR